MSGVNMWIEIYEKKYEEYHLINSPLVESIYSTDNSDEVEVVQASKKILLLGKPFYHALIMALQGHDVDLGELGYVRPLKNGKREEMMKHLSYLEAMGDQEF